LNESCETLVFVQTKRINLVLLCDLV